MWPSRWPAASTKAWVFGQPLAAHPAGQAVGLLFDLGLKSSFYLIADAYYASRKVALPLLDQGHHLVTRLRCTANRL